MSPYEYKCSACGRVMDERSDPVWNKVQGWERKREQGGTNYILARRPLPEYMCDMCAKRIQGGDHPRQMVMF